MTCTAVAASAQSSAAKALVGVPSTLVSGLSSSQLADLIDYWEAGLQTHTLLTPLGDNARLLELTNEVARLELGPGSFTELVMLPWKNDTLTAVVTTVETPARDSHLTLYDSRWRPVKSGWKEPKLADWAIDKRSRETVEANVPFMLAEYSLDPKTGVLTLTRTIDSWLSKDARPDVRPLMFNELKYRWIDGKGFVREK